MSDIPGICVLVHGDSKVGKTRLGATTPAPRLILDAEGGTRFLGPTKKWDGASEPPVADGTWETCVVIVKGFSTLRTVYQWLNSGKHPFRSVVIDSLSEVQQRCVDEIAGTNSMEQKNWGDLFRLMSTMVRQFRDLITHPTNPLDCVLLVAMTREINNKKMAHVQGQLATTLPYYIDVVGYMYAATDDNGQYVRRLAVTPHALYDAGDRTGLLGAYIDNPNMTYIVQHVHNYYTQLANAVAAPTTNAKENDK